MRMLATGSAGRLGEASVDKVASARRSLTASGLSMITSRQ